MRGCCLRDTRLGAARLNFADLSGALDLLPKQLAGADLSGAKLDVCVDQNTAHITALTNAARKVFFVMLLAIAYTWLTIASTSDIDLLTNASTTPLPIILTELPILGFYWTAPLLLIGFYIYLHLHLQRLWEDLAALPAYFPDGRPVDEHVSPWLLISLIRTHSARLQDHKPPLARLQSVIAVVLAWQITPLTLGAIWLRFLPRHDAFGSGFHVLCLIFVAVSGLAIYRLGRTTLAPGGARRPWYRSLSYLGTLVLALALTLTSYGIISSPGEYSILQLPRADRLLQALGYYPHADFSNRDVSQRPEATIDMDSLDQVRGVNLENADLHHLEAVNAFLARADLRNSNLQRANLELADLRGAQLQESRLQKASLLQTDLRNSNLADTDLREAALILANLANAKLNRADLRGAFLNQADLRNADLSQSDLRGAYLNQTDLRNADLTLARLADANLYDADLRDAKGLLCTQLALSLVNNRTRLPTYLDCQDLIEKP